MFLSVPLGLGRMTLLVNCVGMNVEVVIDVYRIDLGAFLKIEGMQKNRFKGFGKQVRSSDWL